MSGILGALTGGGPIGGGFAERFLRPASLRGQGFWIDSSEDQPGRRWVAHEFPGRDQPWHEDLGKRSHDFAIEGLLIGDDVVQQAQAFRDAVEVAEPARLVHPWYGELDVTVIACKIRFDQGKGRIARLSLTLAKAGPLPAPDLFADLAQQVSRAIGGVTATVLAQVQRLRGLVGAADYLVGTATGIVAGLAGAMRSALAGAGLGTIAPVQRAIDALGSLGADAADPARAAVAIATAARQIAGLAGGTAAPDAAASGVATGDPAAAFAALLALAGAAPPPPPVDDGTAGAALAIAAATDLGTLIAVTLATEAARVAPNVAWTSREEAIAARDRLADLLGAAMDRAGEAGWDEVWRALSALRGDVVAEIAQRAAPLPRIAQLVLPAPLPASLLAYRLDGDRLADVFDRGIALALRNHARHPGFLPAGRALEVLL
ncbi:MAG TPA: DNA circularization N-terminal domain-containing protein [Roseomonas sp.]|jgi:prophage DNA circulation protein